MNTNLYFLIQKKFDGSVLILNGPDILPTTYLNVSNFSSLEQSNPDLIKDLSWVGKSDLGFWLAIFGTKPSPTFDKKIVSNNTIIFSNQTVEVTYFEVNLDPDEINEKKQSLKARYSSIRDSYLKLTDFTQLTDAPISVQAKSDFAIFRQQLRVMFDISDYSQLSWPEIPTSAPNIIIPPFPTIDFS